jgi:hypothetical protein
MSHRLDPDERSATRDRDDDTPLAEFHWSDGVVGMGYFPDEVGLPRSWTWRANAIKP